MGKNLTQKEHVELLTRYSKKRNGQAKAIQEAYEAYYKQREERQYEVLVNLVDNYVVGWIRKQLYNKGNYDIELEHDIMQECRIQMWDRLGKDLDADILRENYAFYVFKIYQNRYFRILQKKTEEYKKYGNVASIDESLNEDGMTLGDVLPPETSKEVEKKKMKKAIWEIFSVYCQAFMEAKIFPPRSLAFFYARLFPHLLRFNHEIKVIPETKTTSAKWAFETMGTRTVQELKEDSQCHLQEEVSEDLIWGSYFCEQLEEEIEVEGGKERLKNVIYTSVYDKGKIEDWADNMHKKTAVLASKIILQDEDLQELVQKYISESYKLYELVKGGER